MGEGKTKILAGRPGWLGMTQQAGRADLHVGTGTRACRQRAGPGSQLAAVAGNTE